METRQAVWEPDTVRFQYAKNPRVNIQVPSRSRVEQSRQLCYVHSCGKSIADDLVFHEPLRMRTPESGVYTTRAQRKRCGSSISLLIYKLAHDNNVNSIAQRVDLSKEKISGLLKALADYFDEEASKDDKSRIVETPNVCGGDARIRGSRIPVWTLEVARRDGCSDGDILSMYPTLEKADLIAAWDWVSLHRAQIDSAIRENEEE